MPTAIGIFASRDKAERAFHELLNAQVPRNAISLLTLESSEPRHTGRTVGAYVGGAIGTSTGLSLGLAAATLVVPGIGPVLAIGLGAAALLGLGGVTAGKSVGSGLDELNEEELAADPSDDLPDAAFFHNMLRQNRSVIVVETNAAAHARAAAVLDRLGMGGPPDESQDAGQLASRKVGDVLVISLSGRIVAGASTDAFRELVENSVELGAAKILVDMSAVTFIDSSGIGELVHAFLRARKAGGQLRLTRLSEKILDLMRMTHLDKVMDIENDEAQALAAFAS